MARTLALYSLCQMQDVMYWVFIVIKDFEFSNLKTEKIVPLEDIIFVMSHWTATKPIRKKNTHQTTNYVKIVK